MIEENTDLPSDIPLSARAKEGVPFHDDEVGVSGSLMEVAGTVLQDETSSSRPPMFLPHLPMREIRMLLRTTTK